MGSRHRFAKIEPELKRYPAIEPAAFRERVELLTRADCPMKMTSNHDSMLDVVGLPGEELIRQGLDDIASGVESVPPLLVTIGYPRLRGLNSMEELKNNYARTRRIGSIVC